MKSRSSAADESERKRREHTLGEFPRHAGGEDRGGVEEELTDSLDEGDGDGDEGGVENVGRELVGCGERRWRMDAGGGRGGAEQGG